MIGLLIEVDFSTGWRAGGINPKDKHLLCHGWQNLDTGLEIRIIEDGRKIEQYQGVKGVTILEGKDAINKAIKDHTPDRYGIFDMQLMLAHAKEKRVGLGRFAGLSPNQVATSAHLLGLAGVTKRTPKLLE